MRRAAGGGAARSPAAADGRRVRGTQATRAEGRGREVGVRRRHTQTCVPTEAGRGWERSCCVNDGASHSYCVRWWHDEQGRSRECGCPRAGRASWWRVCGCDPERRGAVVRAARAPRASLTQARPVLARRVFVANVLCRWRCRGAYYRARVCVRVAALLSHVSRVSLRHISTLSRAGALFAFRRALSPFGFSPRRATPPRVFSALSGAPAASPSELRLALSPGESLVGGRPPP